MQTHVNNCLIFAMEFAYCCCVPHIMKTHCMLHLLQVATMAWVKGTNVSNDSWSDVSSGPNWVLADGAVDYHTLVWQQLSAQAKHLGRRYRSS
jgi:hypothetical protein